MKTIDSNKSIYELSQEYPDVVSIMVELGFKDILQPGMLQSAGRVMTLRKGAVMKKLDWQKIEAFFSQRGYQIQ